MSMKRYKIIAALMVVSILAAVGQGCANNGTTSAPEENVKETYNAPYAASPAEYMIFINKQITPVTNQLTTQILMAQNVSKGKYPIESALNSAKASLKVVQDSKENVKTMIPPETYKENRMEVLRCMENAENTLSNYIKELENGSTDTKQYADIMQSDYIALTGQATAYYE